MVNAWFPQHTLADTVKQQPSETASTSSGLTSAGDGACVCHSEVARVRQAANGTFAAVQQAMEAVVQATASNTMPQWSGTAASLFHERCITLKQHAHEAMTHIEDVRRRCFYGG
ncbi:hypothetical protein [Bifidobacterium gallicum]|nr:hypothetical protein [Bifidobacterium gallicum]KFI58933.1 hypothetical protein BGLCM_1230 [Bifidobacterium gallicum DSM 20093 = LMG 11596]